MNESMRSNPNIDPRLAFDRRVLLLAYSIFALCAAITYISHIDLSPAAYPGYTSGLAVLLIALPALAPYLLSGVAAWQLTSNTWRLLPKHRRLRLYLMLLMIAAGTLFSSLLMMGIFDVTLTRLMTIGLFIVETVTYLGAAGLFLSDDWRST